MSRVYVASELALGRQAVIKPAVLRSSAVGVSSERFSREIQLAARLQHPADRRGPSDGLPSIRPVPHRRGREPSRASRQAGRDAGGRGDAGAPRGRERAAYSHHTAWCTATSSRRTCWSPRRCDGHRLRRRQALSSREAAHLGRDRVRHADVHGARAGDRRPTVDPRPPLRVRRDGVRVARRSAPVQRAHGARLVGRARDELLSPL